VDAIEALTTRASPRELVEPAPDARTLDRILRAGMRAPDHGRLRPWRFIIVAGAARTAFGDVLAAALQRREPGVAEAALAKERGKPLRAPLIISVPGQKTAGQKTAASSPSAAARAATALARLPVEGQANTLLWNSRAALSAQATTRSLKELVGFVESSLTQRFSMPSSRPRLWALSRRVKPGSMLGLCSMSSGTGSSAL